MLLINKGFYFIVWEILENFNEVPTEVLTRWAQLEFNHHSGKQSYQSHGYVIVLLIVVISSVLMSSLVSGNVAVTEIIRVSKVRFAFKEQKLPFLQPRSIPNSSQTPFNHLDGRWGRLRSKHVVMDKVICLVRLTWSSFKEQILRVSETTSFLRQIVVPRSKVKLYFKPATTCLTASWTWISFLW